MNGKWNDIDRPLILASQSPRRKEILNMMGLTFHIESPAIDNENDYFNAGPIETSLKELARAKAESVSVRHGNALVLGSDTVVVVDGHVIGKPVDRRDARAMLEQLSGKQHTVYTGVALLCTGEGFMIDAVATTEVFFRTIPTWELDEYLDYNEYADKAGAYAIQGKAMTFIDKINGCFYNVMGLPMTETIRLFNAYTVFSKGKHECLI